jgi:hypothetical protein
MHIIPLFQFKGGVFISNWLLGKYTGLKRQKEPAKCSDRIYIYIREGSGALHLSVKHMFKVLILTFKGRKLSNRDIRVEAPPRRVSSRNIFLHLTPFYPTHLKITSKYPRNTTKKSEPNLSLKSKSKNPKKGHLPDWQTEAVNVL